MNTVPEIALYVFFGLIATGKSTLATAWAERHNLSHYNSDVVRKELAGLAPTASRKEAAGQGIYSREFSRKTYDALLERAEAELRRGRGVILDASYQSRAERDRVRELAKHLQIPVVFILCDCDEAVKRARLDIRARDPKAVSDGRWDIYLGQKQRFEAPDELAPGQLITLDTDVPVDTALDKIDTWLKKEFL